MEGRNLWDRCEGEGESAYGAFRRYISQRPGKRTMLRAYHDHLSERGKDRKPSHIPGTWGIWRKNFKWTRRARAYDEARS